jgi:hypothetical protein
MDTRDSVLLWLHSYIVTGNIYVAMNVLIIVIQYKSFLNLVMDLINLRYNRGLLAPTK